MASGPGQDMFDSAQIIGRAIYQRAKVGTSPALCIFVSCCSLKPTDIIYEEVRMQELSLARKSERHGFGRLPLGATQDSVSSGQTS